MNQAEHEQALIETATKVRVQTVQDVAHFLRINVNNGDLIAKQVLAAFGVKDVQK